MDYISKPSITKLCRKAGVKSMSDDCVNTIRQIMDKRLRNILTYALIMNSEHQTKTLMVDDIYEGLYFANYNMTFSNEINK